MKRFSFKRAIAHALTISLIAASLFPGGAYAGEVNHAYVEQDYSEECDTPVDVIEDKRVKIKEVNTNEVNLEEVEVVEEQLEEVVEADNKKKVTVAVIDTGLDLNNAVLKERLADGYDPNMTDENGHGTLMAEIICSQTSENVKILPLKAFDDDGNSTVGQVYDTIMSACESDVDVINLSISGAGTSKMLTHAINYANTKGITVVVAAGNNASDVVGFMPGNIENAITVSATDENKAFAEYSNYGDLIDFAATGTIIKDHGTKDTSDDEIFQGTSIASAYVSGYAAFILDNNENADIQKNLMASAEDKGDVGKDNYYGKGYLSLETLSFDINVDGSILENEKPEENVDEELNTESEEKEENTESEETEEDKKQELSPAGGTWTLFVNSTGYGDGSTFWNSLQGGCGWSIACAVNDAYYIWGFDTLILHIQEDSYWVGQLYVPAGKKLVIYGGGKSWKRTAPEGTSSNIYLWHGATLECHDMNFYDLTNTNVSFNDAPGCISGCNLDYNPATYGTVNCYNCYFYSKSHWWSVYSGYAGYFDNCTFDNSNGNYNFGALCLFNGGTVKNCRFVGRGGSMSRALSLTGATTVQNCTINGYGGMNPAVETDGNLNISNTTIDNYNNKGINNSVTNSICLKNNSGTTSITNCTIRNANYGIHTGAATTNLYSGNVYSNNCGIDNSGTINMFGGNVYSNTAQGVQNSGNFNMTGGSIHSNTIGLYNNAGTSTMTAGTIKDSAKMNVDVYNGTVNFKGGSITGSGAGYYGVHIENSGSATFNQFANIGSNHAGGVRNKTQDINRYNVYNGVTTAVGSMGNDIGVLLEAGASMTIHQPLTKDVKVASYDRYTGKVIANCANEAVANSAQNHLKLTNNASFQRTTLNTRKYADMYSELRNAYGYNYQALWNHYNANGRNEGRINDDADKTVVYRKGNGNTGAKTQIIVSQVEPTSFDTNLTANGLTNERFIARIRTSDNFTGHKNAQWRDYVETYWGEKNSPRAESIVYLDSQDVSKSIYNSGWASTRNGAKEHNRILTTYAAWYPTMFYAKYETGYDPNANHNPTDDSSKDDGTDDIIDPNPQDPEIVPNGPDDPDNPNPQGYSYFFNGNGQDKGENYTVRHISSTYKMPNNAPFEKEIHSGQGWSIVNNANYKMQDEPTKCRKEGETVNTLVLLNAMLGRDDCILNVSNGNITITQFVVWDKVPEIEAKDVSISQAWLDMMIENEIKEKIFETVIGTDKEDGTLPNNKAENEIGVTITDFDMNELKAFQGTGSVTITFRATDGVGNTTDKQVHLWVNSKNPLEDVYVNRARCINKEYYNAGKVSVGLEESDPHYLDGYKKGGLMPTDLWYTDEEYKKVINEAFTNLENEDWEYTWYFTHEQVLETQDYIDEHGFGDSEEDGALMNYFNTYKEGFTDYTK